MTYSAPKIMMLSIAIATSLGSTALSAQERLGGLTMLNPDTNMYKPFRERQSQITETRSRASVQAVPASQGEVDVRSYKVSPVPSFLIEEAAQDKMQRGNAVASEVTHLNMTEGKVAEKKKSEKAYLKRPKLWYGGPWRKG